MTEVLPAIIPINKIQLEEEIKKVSSFSDLVQVDISDGIFTNTKTWPYNGRDVDYFESLKKEENGWPEWEKVDVELHMMVISPENVLNDWINTGVTSIVAHVESTENFQEVIDICKEKIISVGVAIKPSTDISKIEPFVSGVDFIQVMGSDNIGKHGVELEPKAVEVIKSLRGLYPSLTIAIDIGVTEENAGMLVEAGANKLISGGAILNSDDPERIFDILKSV